MARESSERPPEPSGEQGPEAPDMDSDAANLETRVDKGLHNATTRRPGEGGEARAGSPRYRIGSVIGQGGMATVYDGYDKRLERSVAIKVLRDEHADDPAMLERFFHEARLLSQLDHPGLIPVFDIGELPGYGPFYAMKKVQGRTLRMILRDPESHHSRGGLDQAQHVAVFEKVCQTVAYAHARGIVHRDLKPENIMVDDYGVVLVLDWGLSKRLFEGGGTNDIMATRPGVVQGTPSYMSPEQAQGRIDEIGFGTDVFALGAMLYEILTGEYSFRGSTPDEILEQVKTLDPPPAHKVNRKASRMLSAVAGKALSKDAVRRYATAKELGEEVRAYRQGETPAAYTLRLRDRAKGWIGRHPALTTGLTMGVLLALFLSAGGYHRYKTETIRRQGEELAERRAEVIRQQQQRRRLGLVMEGVAEAVDRMTQVSAELLAAKQQLEDAEDSEEQRRLELEVEELTAVLDWYKDVSKTAGAFALAEMGGPAGIAEGGVQAEAVNKMRELLIRDIEAQGALGNYFNAHNETWRYLVDGAPLGWTTEQTARLLKLKERFEQAIREEYGPDTPIPDWTLYQDEIFTPRELLQNAELLPPDPGKTP